MTVCTKESSLILVHLWFWPFPCYFHSWNPILHHSDAAAAAAKSLQSCPTLRDPTDGSPWGSPVPGILQARTLKWVAISFSNAWKWKVKVKSLSRPTLSDPMDCGPPGSSVHGIFQARVLEWGAIAFSHSDAILAQILAPSRGPPRSHYIRSSFCPLSHEHALNSNHLSLLKIIWLSLKLPVPPNRIINSIKIFCFTHMVFPVPKQCLACSSCSLVNSSKLLKK